MHGALDSAAFLGDSWVRNAGFLEYAATNDLIVIFPQNTWNPVTNPFGLWSVQPSIIQDEDYYNRNGRQPQAFK